MSRAWIIAKVPEFVRDMFRDFCLTSKIVEEQFRVFDQNRTLQFEAIKDVLGVEMNKGLLWRLKDTAHHVFKHSGSPEGKLLDWCIGYTFHECQKLKESTYLQWQYHPKLHDILEKTEYEIDPEFSSELDSVMVDNTESMSRIVGRIRFLGIQSRTLLPYFLREHNTNTLLARFIFAQNELVRFVFRKDYDKLIRVVYDDEPEMMYVLASQSLRLGGWVNDAAKAAATAHKLNSNNEKVLQEKGIVDNWSKRFNG